jgi:hypothetical protein
VPVLGAPPALVVVDPVDVGPPVVPPAPVLVMDPVLPGVGLLPESSDEHRACARMASGIHNVVRRRIDRINSPLESMAGALLLVFVPLGRSDQWAGFAVNQ